MSFRINKLVQLQILPNITNSIG